MQFSLNYDSTVMKNSFCIRLDKDAIVKEISARKKLGHRHPRKNIFRAYGCLLCKYMHERITTFLAKHNHALSDVAFQCDSDCRDFIKVNGLRHDDIGNAHGLSDIVAWSNNKNKEPEGQITGPQSLDRCRIEKALQIKLSPCLH